MFKDHPDLKWLVLILIGMWFVWFFTGGPARFDTSEGPFLKPSAPLDTGDSYGPR
jgi:hypothetical protein